MKSKLFKSATLACACTAALTLVACDNSASRQTSTATTPAAGTAAKTDNQAVTLTGCLMRGDGRNDFVLTKANEPVGTSGASQETGSIAARTRSAAARSYRLNGDNDELEK